MQKNDSFRLSRLVQAVPGLSPQLRKIKQHIVPPSFGIFYMLNQNKENSNEFFVTVEILAEMCYNGVNMNYREVGYGNRKEIAPGAAGSGVVPAPIVWGCDYPEYAFAH
jgi:hypothetical protein